MRASARRLLRARRVSAVDSHDAKAFPAAATRTSVLRLATVGAALALVLAAVASARDVDTRSEGLIAKGTTGVVVVDLSLSIASEDYHTVRRAFRRLVAEKSSIGLVVFSDVAYELLPPGTPASELEPMLRLLVPPRSGQVVNPWTQEFRAGTRISSALELARRMLERDEVEAGSILLVSDLETSPEDVPVLARVVRTLQSSAIQVRVVALGASSDGRRIFEGLVQPGAFEAPDPGSVEVQETATSSAAVPRRLVVLALLLFLVLAVHEHFGGRLALPRGERKAAG